MTTAPSSPDSLQRRRALSCYTKHEHEGDGKSVNENFSLVVMCLFLLASLAFLAQQLTSYH